MPETEHYTNLVLGSGEAGKYIAWTLAKPGSAQQLWNGSTSEALAPTSRVCPVRSRPTWKACGNESDG